MLATPLAFPQKCPAAYEPLADEPVFDPARHLALERPARSWSLADLGYGKEILARTPSPLAFTTPFRLLSPEGVAAVEAVAARLRHHAGEIESDDDFLTNRILTYLAGGVYRSRFLRDLCGSPEVADFLSELAETPLAPHSLPSQQLYINYAPPRVEDHVDIWHADSIGFDYVLLASDPASFEGGEFEVFLGTRAEAAALGGLPADEMNRGIADAIPQDRIASFTFPAAGYAIFQQGYYVIHRAKRLAKPAERMTLVPGYVPLDMTYGDPIDMARMSTYGEPGIQAEVLRHGAWRAKAKLEHLLAALDPDGDLETGRAQLRDALAEAERALAATAGNGKPIDGPANL